MSPARSGPDEKLSRYRSKRDFDRTEEPAGAVRAGAAGASPSFVVQRHRARALHYDVRLEIDGVLVSWAVPKGPTLDAKARRLAVRTEDHPMEYADFEGVIPPGEYGGGDVIVWDRGTWELHGADDAGEALRAGELHVELHGEKLRGRFVLVRTGPSGGATGGGNEQWLLLHKRDEHAVAGWDAEDHPESVRSGRTNDEVAAEPEPRWDPSAPADRRALDALGDGPAATIELDGHSLELTTLDQVVAPGRDGEDPVTKRDVIAYAVAMAPLLLAHLADRALVVRRPVEGGSGKGALQRAVPRGAPGWVGRRQGAAAGAPHGRRTLVADSAATLVWLADRLTLELHASIATTAHPERPTHAWFGIEAGSATTWEEVLVLARLHGRALEELQVVGVPVLCGDRDVHIWVPVHSAVSHEHTEAWVADVARSIGRVVPDLVGRGRARLGRAAAGRAPLAPYSTWAAPGLPVCAPVTWDELDDADLRPDRWTVRTIGARIAEVGDVFEAARTTRQRLPTLS